MPLELKDKECSIRSLLQLMYIVLKKSNLTEGKYSALLYMVVVTVAEALREDCQMMSGADVIETTDTVCDTLDCSG